MLEILEQAEPHHLSAEDVYRHLIGSEDSVGLATVYRVLTQFVDAGIVERHNFDDGRAVYEVSKHDHHDHMVDVDTGRVTEFVSDRIETLQREIAAGTRLRTGRSRAGSVRPQAQVLAPSASLDYADPLIANENHFYLNHRSLRT